MKKTYKCRKTYFSTAVNFNGKSLRIEFRGGTIGAGGTSPSLYTTEEKEIQDQIENFANFKNGLIWLDRAYLAEGEEPKAAILLPKTDPKLPVEPPIVPPVDTNNLPGSQSTTGENKSTGADEEKKEDNQQGEDKGTDTVPAKNPNQPPMETFADITNFQKAKNILLQKDIAVPSTTKKDELKELAKAHNIEFPNL